MLKKDNSSEMVPHDFGRTQPFYALPTMMPPRSRRLWMVDDNLLDLVLTPACWEASALLAPAQLVPAVPAFESAQLPPWG